MPTDEAIWAAIDLARDRIARAASNHDCSMRSFATTLVLAIAMPGAQLATHIGDGAIVARSKDGSWIALSWPEAGEYASTTYFLTDEPAPRLRIARSVHDIDALAVMTDGLETIALDEGAQEPHARFFDPMIAPVAAAAETGALAEMSLKLGGFLRSERVCERTDDDKTLILAACG